MTNTFTKTISVEFWESANSDHCYDDENPMQGEITKEIRWDVVDTIEGEEWIPKGHVNEKYLQTLALMGRSVNENPFQYIREEKGYGARFSMDGYLDATPWEVFSTIKEAEDYIEQQKEDFDI